MTKSFSSERRIPSASPSNDEALDEVLRALAHAPPRVPPPDPENGTRWGERGRYVIDRRLGRGGMGTVFLATDTVLGRQVALKVLDAGENAGDEAQRARLLREARLAAGLEHERIARVYDVGEHEGNLFAAMEYVRGATLRRWMQDSHEPAEALEVLTQIAEGLAALHADGIMHRDLKPENVMLQAHPTPPTPQAQTSVKLLDFGLAGHVARPVQAVEATIPAEGVSPGVGQSSLAYMGTPGYMAPEQYAGERADARADVFALGVIVYEIVTGGRPFRGATFMDFQRVTTEPLAVGSTEAWERFPPGLLDVTRRMLCAERAQRLADGAAALGELRALSRAASDSPVAGSIPFVGGVAGRRPRRLLGVAGGVAVLVAAVALSPQVSKRIAYRRMLAAPPPSGMALINVGAMTVGHTTAELDKECVAIGPGCNRKKMQREVPSGRIDVPPFYLDVDEVTNEEMASELNTLSHNLYVADDEEFHYPRYVRFNKGLRPEGEYLLSLNQPNAGIEAREGVYWATPGRERLPVAHVTWYGASLYCTDQGKELPTEDEWEAAARGRDNRPYPWGTSPAHCGGVALPEDGMIRMDPGCAKVVDPLGVGLASQDLTPEGVHDLGGNVSEWTTSLFVEDDRRAHGNSAPDAPRTIRGGSWFPASSYLARSAGRTGRPPATAGMNVGFRCARRMVEEPAK